jgi:type IV pilus assembly protein PilM
MRSFRRKRRLTVVVDLGRGSIKMAAAESAGEAARFRGMTLIALVREDSAAGEPEDMEIARRIGELVERRGWRGLPAACLLSGAATSTQSFLFPPMPDTELRRAVALKLEETLHFDLEQALFDFRRVGERAVGGKPRVLTLVSVARKDAVERASTILRRAGLEPAAIGAASEALANLTYYASPCDAKDASIHVDIGSESTILNLFEGRLLRFSREIDTAGESFTRALMRPILSAAGALHLTRDQAEEVKRAAGYPREDELASLPFGLSPADILPLLEPVAQRLISEIQLSARYLAGILERPGIDCVVLTGAAARMRNLESVLEEGLDVPVMRIDPVARAIAHWRLAVCDEDVPPPAGFAAILGSSLGGRRPINLMPCQRRKRVRVLGAQAKRVRRALAPPALALGACLALGAIPIHQKHGASAALLQGASRRLDGLLLEEDRLAERAAAVGALVRHVAAARGGVPHWDGLMKELCAALPEGAHVSRLAGTRKDGRTTLALVARLPRGAQALEARLAEVLVALSASPFFASVQLADPPAAGPDAVEFELELEIAALPSLVESRP